MSEIAETDRTLDRLDVVVSHIWMVRTFLKHSEEAEEDDDLRDVYRDLYDFMLAVGEASRDRDLAKYLKMARKKMKKLRSALALFTEIQPEISSHTNFQMALQSLTAAVEEMESLIDRKTDPTPAVDA